MLHYLIFSMNIFYSWTIAAKGGGIAENLRVQTSLLNVLSDVHLKVEGQRYTLQYHFAVSVYGVGGMPPTPLWFRHTCIMLMVLFLLVVSEFQWRCLTIPEFFCSRWYLNSNSNKCFFFLDDIGLSTGLKYDASWLYWDYKFDPVVILEIPAV